MKGKATPTLVVLFWLNFTEILPRGLRVVAPDLAKSLNISDSALATVLSVGSVAIAFGAVPLAVFADRMPRVKIIAVASFFGALATMLSAFVVNVFQLFWTSTARGIGQSFRIPVAGSLICDSYPIPVRARVFAIEALGRPLGLLCGPLLVGLVATIAGGENGWRWALLIVALAPLLVGLSALALAEPPRGHQEQETWLDGQALTKPETHVCVSTAWARLRKVRTLVLLGLTLGIIGFLLVAVPLQFNLLLADKYALNALERGFVESTLWLPALLTIVIAARAFDYAANARCDLVAKMMAALLFVAALLYAVALPITTIGVLVILLALAQGLVSAAFVGAPIIISLVTPYRIRSQGFALIPVFVYLLGEFFGGVLAGQLSETYNNRTALLILAPTAALLGGYLMWRSAARIKGDAHLVFEEHLEEQTQAHKRDVGEQVAMLRVRNLDFSYGSVQVLFGVELELEKGEVVALLGNNGAGKTTLLRAISGLGMVDAGVINLNGRVITDVKAEARFQQGIVQLRGGEGIFPDLSVKDNLRATILAQRLKPAEFERRVAELANTFPVLEDRLDDLAGQLSGGQQQMLALAMALVHEPKLLLIDELSLGLAPVVVEELLEAIAVLKARGQTMLVVEQSLNVALSFADRVVFMEKGVIRFHRSVEEFAEHGDLARSAFLGGKND